MIFAVDPVIREISGAWLQEPSRTRAIVNGLTAVVRVLIITVLCALPFALYHPLLAAAQAQDEQVHGPSDTSDATIVVSAYVALKIVIFATGLKADAVHIPGLRARRVPVQRLRLCELA